MNRNLHPSFPSALAFDRLIQRAFSTSPLLPRDYPPRERILENPDGFQLSIDLPGLRRDELKLELKDRVLTLSVTPSGDRPFVAAETRSWSLGSQVDPSSLKAQLDLGVLRIELPKVKPQSPETLTIEIQ